jgi:hypothetical protein
MRCQWGGHWKPDPVFFPARSRALSHYSAMPSQVGRACTGQLTCVQLNLTYSFGHALLRVCSVISTRCESRRALQHTRSLEGCLEWDLALWASSPLLITVRLYASCFLQISVAATQTIQDLHSIVKDELGPIGVDAILSWNCSPLSPNDGRRLGHSGIHHGSVIECAFAIRGGTQGTAESTAARNSAQEKVRQCKSKVDGLKTLVDRVMFSIPQPSAGEAAATESGGRRVEAAALRGTGTKVCSGAGSGEEGGGGLRFDISIIMHGLTWIEGEVGSSMIEAA